MCKMTCGVGACGRFALLVMYRSVRQTSQAILSLYSQQSLVHVPSGTKKLNFSKWQKIEVTDDMKCAVMSSNPSRVELGVLSTSVLSRT